MPEIEIPNLNSEVSVEEKVSPDNNEKRNNLPEEENFSKRNEDSVQHIINPLDNEDEIVQSKEYDGYNDITITIKDSKTPIVVLFGPKSCGKTMTLVRLSRYLKENGYVITPDKTFRDSKDEHYKQMCYKFPNMINSDDAASSTNLISFMLAKVTKNGSIKCQILEGPGELYFDEDNPDKEFPTYLNQIITSNNRKIWIFMLEPDWKDTKDRENYVDRITKFSKQIKSRDKVILLVNKVDKADGLVINTGVVKYSPLLKEIKDSYPGILKPFENKIPISNWFEEYRCKIIPFQTGLYSTTNSGKLKYTKSDDRYPKKLWNVIKKIVKG